ncbi:MAG: response regulator transcription factor [Chloroflexota bacterium]
MVEAARILIVEDDRTLAETLAYNLKKEGYEALVVRTGIEAIVTSRAKHPDLILLDIMLPEVDGFEVCRTVRATSTVPIIMLTARDNEVDRVLGLELGADDYVSKPFSLRELLARVRANLRRTELDKLETPLPPVLVHEAMELPREFDLLLYMMRNRAIVLSRDQLLEKVWGADYMGDSRTVDVHVRRLRSKIETDASNPALIQTVHGVGYVFGGNARKDHDA